MTEKMKDFLARSHNEDYARDYFNDAYALTKKGNKFMHSEVRKGYARGSYPYVRAEVLHSLTYSPRMIGDIYSENERMLEDAIAELDRGGYIIKLRNIEIPDNIGYTEFHKFFRDYRRG